MHFVNLVILTMLAIGVAQQAPAQQKSAPHGGKPVVTSNPKLTTVIKKKNGQAVRGEVLGTILLKDMKKGGVEGYLIINYFMVPGKDILSIDENGVMVREDSIVDHLKIVQRAPVSDTEALAASFGVNDLGVYSVETGARVTKDMGNLRPNPNLASLAGELRRAENMVEILPSLNIRTAKGEVTFAVADVVAFNQAVDR